MKLTLTRDLKTELIEVDKTFINNLLPWCNGVYGYLNELGSDITWNILPALVLSIYKYLGINRQLSISMANIFKMFYFAQSIHGLIKDDKEGQKHNQQLQFNILIGDYIYGCVLKLLLEVNADKFLSIFSEMIGEINEGMVIQYKLRANDFNILEKTKAPFYSTAFLTAAEFSGIKHEKKDLYRQLGHNLGMSIEMLNCGSFKRDVQVYINESERLFQHLNQENNVVNSSLEKVVKELQWISCSMDEVAIII